jgi:ParB-like chromosome segregation protein Spo0J
MIQAEYRDIDTLAKLSGNPRIIKDKQFKTLCKSIKANGDYFEARPCILSDRTGELVIIAGNQRYEAARHLGMKNIPTIILPNLTEEREREIIIRDNVALGEFDWDELANSWDENLLADWGVDVPTFEDIREDEQVENESSKEVKLCPHCGEEL